MAVFPVVDTGLFKQVVERNDPSPAKDKMIVLDAGRF